MYEIEIGILIFIAVITAVITLLFCRKGNKEENYIYISRNTFYGITFILFHIYTCFHFG